MNSKKLGMIAAAALTVVASQASASDAKAKADKGEWVCANSCQVADKHSCAGYALKTEFKTEEACKGKGKWMKKADVVKNMESLKASGTAPAADPHKH